MKVFINIKTLKLDLNKYNNNPEYIRTYIYFKRKCSKQFLTKSIHDIRRGEFARMEKK